MLSRQGCTARRQRLWQKMPSALDVILIHDPKHLVYFANLFVSPFSFRANDAQAALILTRDKCCLLVDNLLEPHAAQAYVDEVRLYPWYQCIEPPRPRGSALFDQIISQLEQWLPGHGGCIGIESSSLPMGFFQAWERVGNPTSFVPIDDTLQKLRRAKDADELALLQRSANIAAEAMDAALTLIQPGMSELELFQFVQDRCTRSAGEPVQVYGDFASGERTLAGGGPPSSKLIQKGDLVILDFSVVLWHYRSDFANSWVVGAKPTVAQQRQYQCCLDALQAGAALLKPGQSCAAIYQAVWESFRQQSMERYFPHHAGHGIGLSHPESPFLVPESQESLQPGDVITLEPGLYIPATGGTRVERNYVITDMGATCISGHQLALSPHK